MSYFVTGATGFIGRHLVEELLDHREGTIFALVRQGSLPRLQTMIELWDTDRVVPVVGDLGADRLGVDEAWIDEHVGDIDHFFHLAAIYDMTADDEANQTMNVGGTRHALELAEALAGRLLPPGQLGRRRRGVRRAVRRDDVRRGPGADLAVPPHEVRVREAGPRRGHRAVARLPAGDRRRPQRDRRDGQGRRPLLPLPRDQAAARRPARLAAAGRRRPRRHQRGAGRLRRRRARPPRPPRGPRRRGLPPGQPRAAAGRGDAQRLLRRRRCPAVRDAARPQQRRRPARARPRPAPPAAARHQPGPHRSGAAAARPDPRPARHPGRGARPHVVPARSSTRAAPRRRWPAPGSPSPTSSPTPARCGATGRTTSTSRPPTTPARARR